MSPRLINLYIVLPALLLGGLLSACQPVELVTSSAPGMSVGITRDLCPNMELQTGQQVTWTNQDTREHIVRDRPGEGAGLFNSGILQTGDSFAFTFVTAGSYIYECTEDGLMTGMITVGP